METDITEIVFFSNPNPKNDIKITNTRAIINGKTYAMANVTSVSLSKTPSNAYIGWLLFLVGLIIIFLLSMQFGWVFVIVGLIWALVAKPSYHVNLGSSSGETDALSSKNRQLIEGIVEAINQAIIHRG
jgi:hypothetical protein